MFFFFVFLFFLNMEHVGDIEKELGDSWCPLYQGDGPCEWPQDQLSVLGQGRVSSSHLPAPLPCLRLFYFPPRTLSLSICHCRWSGVETFSLFQSALSLSPPHSYFFIHSFLSH